MRFTGYLFSLYCLVLLTSFIIGCNKKKGDTNGPPFAGFLYVSQASVPATVKFSNTSTLAPGVTATYRWDFGDGSSSTDTEPTHQYLNPGVYIVKLFQLPSNGNTDSTSVSVNLASTPGPVGSSNRLLGTQSANFTWAIISRSYTVAFSNTSTNTSSYQWQFGDGTTSTTDSAILTHRYNTGGTYHVHLTSSGPNGTDTAGAMISL